MRNLKIKTRLLVFLGILSLLMILVSVFGFTGMLDAQRALLSMYQDKVIHLQVLTRMSDLYAVNLGGSALKAGSGLISFESCRRTVHETQTEIDRSWREFLRSDLTAVESTVADQLRPLMDRAGQASTNLVKLLETEDTAALVEFNRRQLFPAVEPVVNELQKLATAQLKEAEQSNRQTEARFILFESGPLVIVLLGLVVAGLAAYLLIRAINDPVQRIIEQMDAMRRGDFARRLELPQKDEFGLLADGLNRMGENLAHLVGKVQRSGVQVGGSTTQVAAIARQQQATASEMAATTAEIGATSTEIAATSKELLKTIGDVAATAEQTAQLAETGHTELSQMETTMRQIMEAAAAISGKLAVLNEKAGNISTVVTTITKVADQTNLLSLNAAIEAEKAGEYGRGFSVVAGEIRRLADQTAVATYDIEQMVKEMQAAVAAGVMGMDKFSEEVRRGVEDVRRGSQRQTQIIQAVQALRPRFDLVNEGMQSQTAGAQQISEALSQLSDSTRQTAESLQHLNQAMDQLNEASHGLQDGIARFKVEN
jgi:methyl-accepting chemotaxis protein WspA